MSPTHPPMLTAEDVRAIVADDALFERGERLWHQGAVRTPARRSHLLLGAVRGSEPEPYTVSIEPPLPGKKQWQWRCTCPYYQIYGGACKHGVALLLQWAEEPESFSIEASLDERLAGPQREEWLELIQEALEDSPTLQRLLALEPEPKKPLGRPLKLAPYQEQIQYARRRYENDLDKQRQLLRGVLESAAGYLRVGDGANAARLATLLAGELVAIYRPPRPLRRLLFDTLTLLEASALVADWAPDEQRAWLGTLMDWWAEAEREVADRLLDLILHCYRRGDEPLVESWLRELLRRPIQGDRAQRASGSLLWRQRVLSFLLARYEATGRIDAYLDLCWEEGEDALAARQLAEQEEVAEVLRLAEEGLGRSDAHREVATVLQEAGEPDAAWEVARAGLRFNDRGRGALLSWLAARALEQGQEEQALSYARQAWELGPTLERYTLLREAACRAEQWPDLRRALHAAVEHRNEMALLVEILMDENEWAAAAAFLPLTDARRDELTEAVARGMAARMPYDALHLLFDLADLRAEGRSRPAYTRVALALLAARSLAEAAGIEDVYRARLQAFLKNQARRPALKEELARAGLL